MIHRKFGRLLLGKATPFQVVAACVLGAILGFQPGFAQAPGSIILLFCLFAILNANLALGGTIAIGAKLLSFILLPLAHSLGRFLLEGPTEGLFRSLVNAPFFAWCGFDYHAVAGGWLLGGILGLGTGLAVAGAMARIRKAFLSLDEGSEAFRKWAGKGWVKFLSWLLLGGVPKKETYEKIAGKRVGLPVRPLGAALVVLSGILLWALPQLVAGPILTGALRSGLERVNGATVDLGNADLDLAAGRFTLEGLAMADRAELDEDMLRATTVTADLDVGALLSKRFQVTELALERALTGAPRETPGKLRGKTAPPPPQEPPPPVEPEVSIVELEKVLADAKVWYERLGQAERYFDLFFGEEEKEPGETEQAGSDGGDTVARAVESVGYSWTRATHLIEENPTVRLDHLKIARLESMELAGMPFVLEGWNLSTHPSLVAEPAGLSLASDDGAIRLAVNPAPAGGAPQPETIELARRGLSGDWLGSQVRVDGQPVLAGGTIDIEGTGRWWREGGVRLDLPLRFTLNGCEVKIPGTDGLQRIEKLVVPITVGGSLLAPRIRFSEKDLIDGLVAAGKRELADRAKKELTGRISEETDKLKEQLGEKVSEEIEGKVSKELEGKVGEEAKKAAEKIGGGLLEGLKPKPKPPAEPEKPQ